MKIQNHIPNAVHATALCGLVEFAFGLVMEAACSTTLRWIPKGMHVKYLKLAKGPHFTAVASLPRGEVEKWEEMSVGGKIDVEVPVSLKNAQGVEVVFACIECVVSQRQRHLPANL